LRPVGTLVVVLVFRLRARAGVAGEIVHFLLFGKVLIEELLTFELCILKLGLLFFRGFSLVFL